MDSAAAIPARPEASADYDLAVRQIGQYRMVWRRFKRHRVAVIGGVIVLLMTAFALLGPYFAPAWVPLIQGNPPLWATKQANLSPNLGSWRFLMGSDFQGDGVITYVLQGGRALLLIGFLGALIASVLGGLVGSLAGYLGGVIDAVLMRLVDAFLAIPLLLLIILFSSQLPDRGAFKFSLLFGLVGWAGVARLVRGYVLSLREREFAEAARALGVSAWGIILRHLLPNALDILVVSFTLNIAVFIVTEVTLDFLHAGTADVTWGSPLSNSFESLLIDNWWVSFFPAIPIVLTVIGFNFLGDGLRDALDATSTSALISDPGSARVKPPNAVQRTAATGFRSLAAGWTVVSARVAVARAGARGAVARVPVPAPLQAMVGESRGSRYRTYPMALRVGPIVLAALAAGIAVLYGHSPLVYSASYTSPATLTAIYGSEEYGAVPVAAGGGWNVLAVDAHRTLGLERVSASGTVTVVERLGSGDNSTRPSLATNGRTTLGTWVGDGNQLIYAKSFSSRDAKRVALVPPGGIVQNPDVVSVHGGFDVLFGWQPSTKSSEFDIYRASLSRAGRLRGVMRLIRSGDDARYIRAVEDGSGHLAAIYLQRFAPGQWNVLFRRFSRGGAAIGHARNLGMMNYLEPGSNGCNIPGPVPDQWAIDVKRANNGSVWAAWETGVDCVQKGGITGPNTLSIGHWAADGRTLLAPTVVDPAVDANAQAVAVAVKANGGFIYYPQPGSVNTFLTSHRFKKDGSIGAPVRVDYRGGANEAQPRAATFRGSPRILWERVRADSAELADATWHPKQGPNLLTHLGLNIGNPWGNLALIVLGALGGAIALTLINIYLLVPLIVLWPLVRKLIPPVRWTVFLTVLAAILVWIFAAHPAVPDYVLVITSLGFPVGWIVVGGAVFTAAWAGQFLLGRQESGMRATAVGLIGLYFVAAMYVVMYIEGQLGQI